MKKTLVLAAALTAAASLAACGGTKTTTVTRTLAPSSSTASTASVSTTTTQTATPAVNKTCSVPNVVNVTPSTVTVQLKASGYPPAKAKYANCATATTLVQIVAGKKAEEPVHTPNFDCVPAVTGNKANFTCSGADNAINYTFTLNYTG